MRRLAFLLSLTFFGCSDSGGGGGSVVEGLATSVGPISDANVEVHAVGDNGAPQRLLGTTTTESNGDFSLSVDYQGWTLIKIWGGSYTDAATGSPATIPQATPLLGVALAEGSPVSAVVTRATTVLTVDAQQMARDPGMTFGEAVANAALKMQAVTGVPNVHMTRPRNLMSGAATAGPEAQYGAILAGWSEYALNLGVSGPELAYGAAWDATDGVFNGFAYEDQVKLSLSVDMPTGFLTSLGTYSQLWMNLNPNNNSGLNSSDLPGLSALGAAGDMLPKAPRIQAVWKGFGTLIGSSQVIVRGWGFTDTPEVFVGTTEVTPITATDTEVTFDTPPMSAAGDYDLTIRTDIGYSYTAKLAMRFYDQTAAPTVTETVPNEGGTTGGTPVRITGTNLDPDTQVYFGADQAQIVGATYPRQLWVISPKVSAAGFSDITVQNGAGGSVTLTDRFEYKNKDVGRTFDDSDLNGGFSAIFQKWGWDGTDFVATVGRSTWQLNGAGQGTFTRAETEVRDSGTTAGSASGQAFATAEGQSGQVLTVDTGTNETNLYAFTIDPGWHLGAGLTAGGTTSVFKHGTGLSASTLSGKYGLSGSYVKLTPELTFGYCAGTIEFDGEGYGGVNMILYERDSLGNAFRRYPWTLPVQYTVDSGGDLEVQLDPGSAMSWDLHGRVTSDGAFASFYWAGSGAWQGQTASFKVVKLGEGVAPEDYHGEFDGGYMTEKAFDDGIDIVPKLTSYLSYRLLETDEQDSRHFASNDGGSLLPGGIDKIYQTGRVSDRVAGQSGRVEHLDGSIAGYFSPRLGYSISVGKIAESLGGASLTDRLEYGLGVRFDSHYSDWSIDGDRNLLSWSTKWIAPGASITGDEENETSIGSVNFNPAQGVTINGKAFTSFGGFNNYSANSKFVSRIGLEVSTGFGPATDYGAEFGYGFLGDRLHYLIGERDEKGALGNFRPGFTVGKGMLSPSGAVGGFASTGGYDRSSFTAFVPQLSWSIGANYRWGSALWGFNAGSGATLGQMERGTLSVSGMSLSQNYLQRLFTEGAAGSSTSSGSRVGSVIQNPNSTADFILGTQIFGGISIGDADMFLLTDFSANNQTGIQVLTKNAGSTPQIFDYGMSMFTKSFLDTNLPARTSLTLRSATYTPTRNLLSLVGLDQFRVNDTETTALGRQINTGTASADATGAYTFGIGASSFSGGITSDGCFGFGMPGASTDPPTTMSLGIKFNF